jgi:S-adenosylmethionine hydrolase
MKKLVLAILLMVLLVSFIGCSPSGKSSMPVVLLTDFGTDDYRVPRLKGIVYSAYPDVEMIDATHGIPSMDIAAGAYILDLTAQEFPADVVFVASVGRPVNSDEEYIVLLTNNDQIFLAPNNGLLTYIINNMGVKEMYLITNTDLYDRPEAELSAHYVLGRAGALIASGLSLQDVGPEFNDPILLDIQTASVVDGTLKGSVVFIDHFGNCLTNVTQAECDQLGLKVGDVLRVTIGDAEITLKFGTEYNSVPVGDNVAFVNSTGVLQLSINKGNFSSFYNIKAGTNFEIIKLVSS